MCSERIGKQYGRNKVDVDRDRECIQEIIRTHLKRDEGGRTEEGGGGAGAMV